MFFSPVEPFFSTGRWKIVPLFRVFLSLLLSMAVCFFPVILFHLAPSHRFWAQFVTHSLHHSWFLNPYNFFSMRESFLSTQRRKTKPFCGKKKYMFERKKQKKKKKVLKNKKKCIKMLFRRRRKNGATAFFNVEPPQIHRRQAYCTYILAITVAVTAAAAFEWFFFTRETSRDKHTYTCKGGGKAVVWGWSKKSTFNRIMVGNATRLHVLRWNIVDVRLEIFLGCVFCCYLRIGLRFTTQMCTACVCFFAFFGFVAKRMLKMFAQEF